MQLPFSEIMKELREIYDRITYLRQKGMKMKDIAGCIDFAPSVLSALYTTVLPTFFKNIEKGESHEAALDNALIWVNNVSKKKLLGSIPAMKKVLFSDDIIPVVPESETANPFISELERNMKRTAGQIANYSGIYMSYSVSSGSLAMKLEPYIITPAANGNYVLVGHNNAYGTTHWGIAMMNGINHIYLMFNENKEPQLALFNICLKIPMYDRPPFLRGVYTCFDYNYNPIARRILFVKLSDSTTREDFAKLKGCLKTREELSEQERKYYEYTCGQEDVVRMCNIPSPTMHEDDLITEKRILAMNTATERKPMQLHDGSRHDEG